MFILKDMTKRYEVYKLNDTKDIYDIVIRIEDGDEKKAKRVYDAACDMGFGGIYQAGRIRLECVHDLKDSISITG